MASAFPARHPLIPTGSKRRAVALDIENISGVIPQSPRKLKTATLSGLTARHPLLATQASFAFARERVICSTRILLKRNLSYSLTHRHLREPAEQDLFPFDSVFESKRHRLDCIIEYLKGKLLAARLKAKQISEEKDERVYSPKHYPRRFQPVPVNFSPVFVKLRMPFEDVPKNTVVQISLQVAVLKGARTISPRADKAAAKRSKKLYGFISENSSVHFQDGESLRLPHWTPEDRVVIRIASEPPVFPASYAVCRDVRPADQDWSVCRANHFKISASVVSSPLTEYSGRFLHESSPDKTDFEYALIYPLGNNLQVCEMVLLKRPQPLHDGICCTFCRMECDSVTSLLRHLEGIHIGVGFEFDESLSRLYVWLAPDNTVKRRPVDGFVEFNPYVVVRSRNTRTLRTAFKIKNPFFAFTDSRERLVLYWASRRYTSRPQKDSLPRFNLRNVLRVYGVPVKTTQNFAQMPGAQLCRPDWQNLVEYDAEEDFHADLDDEIERRIHRLTYCTLQEQQFMVLWNRFIGPQLRILPMHIRDVLTQFIQRHAKDVEAQGSFPVLVAHIGVLRRRKILKAKDVAVFVRVFRRAVLQG
ncbi:hypothetical protein RvY_14387 [Ramazzottius varieornatus]|uniref:C2H2-type domain-containing protein n=1 Tax=Ramazzottius varieornatus TaxID=947166 RepID=A0A1D1VR39_RAMVA|nr:hypothetical protein RvY_14387 [Ramazzottius varieornatus]